MKKFFANKSRAPPPPTPLPLPGADIDAIYSPVRQQPSPTITPSSRVHPLPPPRRNSVRRESDDNWVVLPNSDIPAPPPIPVDDFRALPHNSLPKGASPPSPYPPVLQPAQPPQPPIHHPNPQQVIPRATLTKKQVQAQVQSPKQQPGLSSATKLPSNGPLHLSNSSHGNGHGQNDSVDNLYEASVHSTQEKPKWGGFFGKDRDKEKDAQQELIRMIGYLTATQSEDWSLVLEVCERASSNEVAAKEAARGLRREFKYAEPSAQLSAARLWAIMLRNSSELFIGQTSQKKFLDSLESVLTSSSTPPVVRERLLDVLGSATFTFPNHSGFANLWRKVKSPNKPDEGIPFDPEDTMFDPPLPRRAANTTPVGYASQLQLQQSQVPNPIQPHHLPQVAVKQGNSNLPPHPLPPIPHRHSKEQRVISLDEDMRRLFEECEMAKNNAQVLSHALTFSKPEELGQNPLIVEFHEKCRASQELIVAQIPWASAGADRAKQRQTQKKSASPKDSTQPATRSSPPLPLPPTKEEKLLAALLAANQELLEVFRVYDDLERLGIAEREEREIEERSKKETRLDRTQIQYIAPDGSFVMESPAPGSGPSRSNSPVPSPHNSQPSLHTSRGLPTPPSQHGHILATQHLPTGHYHNLAPPRPGPYGPRSLSSPSSRTPSPDQSLPTQTNNRTTAGYARIDDDDEHEDDRMLYRPSEKALGKRKVALDTDEGSHHSRSQSPYGVMDGNRDSDDEDRPRYRWEHHITYAYDAVAERAKERAAEVASAAAAAAVAKSSPQQPLVNGIKR